MLPELPIDDVIGQVIDAVRGAGVVVVQAPPGAGKTTRIPPALLDEAVERSEGVLVLEPRRMAARSAARRIASERGGSVGDEVGYTVRFDDATSCRTRLVVMTEGILIRRLQDDPLLDGIGAIVFDEFHERHLDTDLALAMATRVRQARPELKLVVMSATLDPAPIARYLGDAPIVVSQGRQYPVTIDYLRRADRRPCAELVAEAVEPMLARTPGDLLCFLPGVGEIRQAERLLGDVARRHDLAIMPLFGDLSPEDQDRVLAPSPRRKVVLATNVAESSVTIDGVTGVIDSGVARVLRFDPQVGLDRLEIEPISQASCEQRTGRAGRTAPGHCRRLWEEGSHRHRAERETPELRRIDLSGAVLQLRCWGESDLSTFPWFEPPDVEAIQSAERLLQRLGALDELGDPTELGRVMVRFPVAPRLARLLLAGIDRGVPERAALLAAMLSERDPFRRSEPSRSGPPSGPRRGAVPTALQRSFSDVLDRLAALEAFLEGRPIDGPWRLDGGAVFPVRRAFEQLLRLVHREMPEEAAGFATGDEADEGVLRALLDAYPDRLVKRRDVGSDKGLMVGGRGVRFGPASAVLDPMLLLAIDVDGAGSEALVRQASGILPEWLDPRRMSRRTECFLHPTRNEVQARSRLYWDDLVIDERPTELPGDEAQAALLAEGARRAWQGALPKEDEGLRQWLARVRCLAAWRPELQLPDWSDERLMQVLKNLSYGRRSVAELASANWRAALEGELDHHQRRAIETEAPERIEVPSGAKLKVTYEVGRPPVLAARIQELFGWRETPRVAGGRVPILLHLLAPNGRPQQVTDDLASFWKNTYSVVRKELRGRYPKHKWPEDPTTS